jgi:hypothetical protein
MHAASTRINVVGEAHPVTSKGQPGTLAIFDPIGQPFVCTPQIFIGGPDELRRLFGIFGERSDYQALFGEVKTVDGAHTIPGDVLGFRLP